MNLDYERILFEETVPGLNLTRNSEGGYEDGSTSLQWEAWQLCAARIPERRNMRDPRAAEDEPRICQNNRHFWRMGFNAAVESANP